MFDFVGIQTAPMMAPMVGMLADGVEPEFVAGYYDLRWGGDATRAIVKRKVFTMLRNANGAWDSGVRMSKADRTVIKGLRDVLNYLFNDGKLIPDYVRINEQLIEAVAMDRCKERVGIYRNCLPDGEFGGCTH